MLNKIVLRDKENKMCESKSTSHLILVLVVISQLLLAQTPTISGEITYPGHEQNYPNGVIFGYVWQDPTQWTFPYESPIIDFVIEPPVDFNNPVPYVFDDPQLQPGHDYYVSVAFDEDNAVQPIETDAEAWYETDLQSGRINLDAGSVSGINLQLQPMGPPGGDGVDYESQIQPIFNESCAFAGCHMAGHITGLDLSPGNSYGLLVNVGSTNYAPALRVEPFNANNSVIYNKVANTGAYGGQMPPPPNPALAPGDIQLIMDWINEGALAGGENPTISGDITYPGNQVDFPNGKIFIQVWKNPSTWPFPPENEYPIAEEIIRAPDLNYPVNYTVEVTDVAPGDWYYVAAFFDEDTTMPPQAPEAEAWYPDGFELSVASAENVNMALGPIGGGGFSFDFGATGGYAETNFTALDGGPEITMEMFIKLHNPFGPGKVEFIQREMWGQLSYDGGAGGTFMFTLIDIGHIELTWPFSQDDGEWHHIAGDYDGVNMNIYWDGELKHTIPASGGLPSNTWPLRFGEGFDGLADIIRISDVALYQGNNFDPWTQDYSSTMNIHLLYHCNEGSGNQLIDDSGEGHHATITGTPTWDPDEPFGYLYPQLWVVSSGSDYIDLGWDRWPDADQDFARYELRRNNTGGVTPGDPVVLDEPDVNVVSWRDNNVTAGQTYYYMLWMFDQSGIRYETNEVWETPGAVGGHVEGNIHSNETGSGDLIIGLFDPGNSGDEWDPNIEKTEYSVNFPGDVMYNFDEASVYDGSGWQVKAFLDQNSNSNPDGDELYGESGQFTVSGGVANNIDFDLLYYPAGNGRIDFIIESPQAVSGNIYIGVFYDGNPTTGQPDVAFGPVWHDFSSGNYSDFIDGIVEGDDYAVGVFFDMDGSPNSSPDICDAGQDMSATLYNVDVWGTNNIGTLLLADCGGGGHVEGNIHSNETGSGQLVIGLFDPANGGNEWDPDFPIDWSTSFPGDEFYSFDEPGIYDATGWQVKAFLDQNSNWTPDGDELYGESGTFPISGLVANNVDFNLNRPGTIPAVTLNNPANITESTMDISWSVWTGTGQEFDRYEVKRNTTGGIQETDQSVFTDNNINTTGFSDSGLDPDTTYFYRVFVYDKSSNFAGSNEVSGTTTIGVAPVIGISTENLNFFNGNTTLDFTLGNSGTGTLYWYIEINYITGGRNWITSVDPDTGEAVNPDEITITVEVMPSGSIEDANLAVYGYKDSEMTEPVDTTYIQIHLDEWHPGTGFLGTKTDHIYIVAEEGVSDSFSVFFQNEGVGSMIVTNITSSIGEFIPDPIDTTDLPWSVHPGEHEDVLMVVDPTANTGTYPGQITFEVENAESNSYTLDFTVDILPSGSVVVNTVLIDSLVADTLLDLTAEYLLSINVTSLAVTGAGLTITLVDGSVPPVNPDGDTTVAVAPRYWEIVSDLEQGSFTADLCFDLSKLGTNVLMAGINDFGGLKIFKRNAFGYGSWIRIPEGDLSWDEQNNIICALGQTEFSQWTVGSDSSGTNFVPARPEVSVDLQGISAKEGNPIVVTMQATAEAGLKGIRLRYWIGGDQLLRDASIDTMGSDTYRASIRAEHVTNKGLIGFVAAIDSLNRVKVTDTTEISVEFDSLFIYRTTPETYSMISVPGNLNLKTANPVLFEKYDDTQLRILRWKNNGYQEYPLIDKLDPGKAFWIVTRDAVDLYGGTGKSTQLMTLLTISLDQGWNQIANPYNFGNGINDLTYTPGSIEPTFHEYDGSGYRTVNMMNPGKGYWLFAYENTSIVIRHFGSGLNRYQVTNQPYVMEWGGKVKASVGGVYDIENIFGVTANSSERWDELDRHEPPVIGDYITLAFDNTDWEEHGGLYSQDIRNDDAEGYVWSFVVKTNQEGYANLDIEKIKELPPDWDLFVLDRDLGIVHKAQEMNQYRFVSTGSEIERNFSLITGSSSFTKEIIKDFELIPTNYTLLQNVPNPFNAITTIRFGLPEDGKVSLTIYSILGQKVAAVISEQEFTAGSHAILWDGKNDTGRGVATGVYLYNLTVRKDGVTKFHQARKLVLLK